MRKIKVGIIGSGGIAQIAHIPSYKKAENVEVAAIADINEVKLRVAADKFGIATVFTDWRDMLESDLDAVSICSPNAFHAEQAIAALKAGKHVLCEKPVCLQSSDVEKIFAAAEQSGKKFMAAFPRRFSGEAKVLKTLIDKGDFGGIYYVKTGYLRRRGIPGLGSWFTGKDLAGGGAMMDIGVHALDFVIYLMGGPLPVMVAGSTYDKFKDKAVDCGWPPAETRVGDRNTGALEVEDLASGYVKLDNGATLFIEAAWACNLAPQTHTTILGDKSGAQLPDPADASKPVKIFSETAGILTDCTPTVPTLDSFQGEIDHFLDCIRKDKEPITKKNEVLSVVRIIEGVYKSAATGQPVIYK